MIDVSPTTLVTAYHRGMLTGHELAFRLIQAAVRVPPEAILPLVPEELFDDVRHQGMNPPERPDAKRFMTSVCATGPFDLDAWQREQQAAYYDGAWRWHRFWTNQPT